VRLIYSALRAGRVGPLPGQRASRCQRREHGNHRGCIGSRWQVDRRVVMARPDLGLAAEVTHQRLVQGGVLNMSRLVVEEDSLYCPMATLGVDPVGAGSWIDLKGVSERLAVGEKWDAAQLKEPVVVGPGPHLLVLARHLVLGEVQADDVVSAASANRVGVRGNVSVVDHVGIMQHLRQRRQGDGWPTVDYQLGKLSDAPSRPS
jgi:hypothetical protein